MSAQLPVIEVSGSPYEIGYLHGKQCKERIKDALRKFLEYMKMNANLSKERLIELSSLYVPYAKEYAPDLVEEMKGIADWIGPPIRRDLCLEFPFHGCDGAMSAPLPNPSGFGCTSLAVFGRFNGSRRQCVHRPEFGLAFESPGKHHSSQDRSDQSVQDLSSSPFRADWDLQD